jgi:uncharacterized protein (TIGR02147 family)
MQNIFNYFDYRSLLINLLAEKHKVKPSLSSRTLALRSGIDPSFFSKALRGARNITAEQTLKIAAVLGFDREQTEYFELLVRFNQCRGHDAKRLYFEKLLEFNKTPDAAPLTGNQYKFYSKWYYAVIRELLHFHPAPADDKTLAKMLLPPIKPAEAREAVALLEKLAIIKTRPGGGFELSDLFITAGPEVKSFAIRNFQMSMMAVAKNALESLPKEKREISAMTLSLSEEGFNEVRNAIVAFRTKLRDISHNDKNISGVYQINFQAFPVTRTLKRDDTNVS